MSDDINDISGLPDELGISEDLTRSEQQVVIHRDSRRYGKAVTIIEGFDTATIDLDDLASTLKSKLAVGGTVTDDRIELQGKHEDQLEQILRDEGFEIKSS